LVTGLQCTTLYDTTQPQSLKRSCRGNANHAGAALAGRPAIVNNPNRHTVIFLALTLDMGEDHQRRVTIAVNQFHARLGAAYL
jgi:hypothetical protein